MNADLYRSLEVVDWDKLKEYYRDNYQGKLDACISNTLDFRIKEGTENILNDKWGQLIIDLMDIKQSTNYIYASRVARLSTDLYEFISKYRIYKPDNPYFIKDEFGQEQKQEMGKWFIQLIVYVKELTKEAYSNSNQQYDEAIYNNELNRLKQKFQNDSISQPTQSSGCCGGKCAIF